MTFEARMAAYLADSTITALVSTRAYAVSGGEQVALPYLVWQRIASDGTDTHDEDDAKLEEITVQVSCFASTHAAAVALRRAVRAVIARNDAAGPATASNLQDLGHDDDRRAFGVSIDFAIWHDDSTA